MLPTFRSQLPLDNGDTLLRFGGEGWAEIVKEIKSLPWATYKWDAERKAWLVSPGRNATAQRKLGEIVQRFSFQTKGDRESAALTPAPAVLIEERIAASRALTSASKYAGSRSGKELYEYQVPGVDYLLACERGFLADEMGLGKTCQALVAAREANAFPLVIVVPASLKTKWAREAADWLFRGCVIQTLWSGKDRVNARAEVVVVNYELLAPAKEGTRYTKDLVGLAAKIKALKPAGLIVDESHRVKDASARRTKAVRLLAEGIRYRWLLTGTAVVNRPTDYATQLAILGRLPEFGGWKWFNAFYSSDVGKKKAELDKLNGWLRSVCYVRREKKDGLPGLPPKTRATVEVEIDNREEYEKLKNDLQAWLRDRGKRPTSEALERIEANAKVEYLRQVSARGKLEAAKAWIRDFLESGQKLVVFAVHREITLGIAKNFGARTIIGGMSASEKDEAIRRFQEGDDQLIVCNVQAGGVGIDLFAASNVLFLEFAWTPAEMEQAEDRCHRNGQKDAVTAWYMTGTRTIDEAVLRLLERKRQMCDLTTKGQSVMAELLKELRYA